MMKRKSSKLIKNKHLNIIILYVILAFIFIGGKKMNKKIVGIVICMLLIITTIPAFGTEALNGPTVEITRPKGIYIFDKQLIPFPFNRALVIGPITISIECTNINETYDLTVYIDGEHYSTNPDCDHDGMYNESWSTSSFGPKKVQVVLEDSEGNATATSNTVKVWKFI